VQQIQILLSLRATYTSIQHITYDDTNTSTLFTKHLDLELRE